MPSLESAYAQIARGGEHLAELKILHDEICAEQGKSTVVKMKLEGTIPPGATNTFVALVSRFATVRAGVVPR